MTDRIVSVDGRFELRGEVVSLGFASGVGGIYDWERHLLAPLLPVPEYYRRSRVWEGLEAADPVMVAYVTELLTWNSANGERTLDPPAARSSDKRSEEPMTASYESSDGRWFLYEDGRDVGFPQRCPGLYDAKLQRFAPLLDIHAMSRTALWEVLDDGIAAGEAYALSCLSWIVVRDDVPDDATQEADPDGFDKLMDEVMDIVNGGGAS